jgi:hypothetical protein
MVRERLAEDAKQGGWALEMTGGDQWNDQAQARQLAPGGRFLTFHPFPTLKNPLSGMLRAAKEKVREVAPYSWVPHFRDTIILGFEGGKVSVLHHPLLPEKAGSGRLKADLVLGTHEEVLAQPDILLFVLRKVWLPVPDQAARVRQSPALLSALDALLSAFQNLAMIAYLEGASGEEVTMQPSLSMEDWPSD